MTIYQNAIENGNIHLPVFGHADYLISIQDGSIRHIDGTPIPTYIHRAAARLYKRCKFGYVHRVVMESVLQRPLATHEQVQHLDGNSLNNAASNLHVGTAKSNALDKIASNTNGHRLRNQDVREIRILRMSVKRIAALYRISAWHVSAIRSGRRWANLP